jgi:hypothetical protein
LLRFPPHKKTANTLISYTTYFKLKKEGVLVSLKAWNGDIESFYTLDEVWVQIRGVPPKWSTWKLFRQIASTLGLMTEIDWGSLFASFLEWLKSRLLVRMFQKFLRRGCLK